MVSWYNSLIKVASFVVGCKKLKCSLSPTRNNASSTPSHDWSNMLLCSR